MPPLVKESSPKTSLNEALPALLASFAYSERSELPPLIYSLLYFNKIKFLVGADASYIRFLASLLKLVAQKEYFGSFACCLQGAE